MRESLKKGLAAVEAVAAPEIDISAMSLEELEAFVDAEARLLSEAAGSVDAFLAQLRQYVSADNPEWHAARLDRYR
jgi:hypothetical protein